MDLSLDTTTTTNTNNNNNNNNNNSIQWMDTNRIPKQTLQYKPKGRKHIGRPRKRWRDQFHFEDQGTGNTPTPSCIR